MSSKIILHIRRYIQAGRAAKKARHDTEITLRLRIVERSGRIFIVCGDTAVAELPQTQTVSDVADAIARARRAALTYDTLTAATTTQPPG